MAIVQLHIRKCITPDTVATCLAAVTKHLTRNTHEGVRAYFGPLEGAIRRKGRWREEEWREGEKRV